MTGELCNEEPRWRLSPTEPAAVASYERACGIVTIHKNLHPGQVCKRQSVAAEYVAAADRQMSA